MKPGKPVERLRRLLLSVLDLNNEVVSSGTSSPSVCAGGGSVVDALRGGGGMDFVSSSWRSAHISSCSVKRTVFRTCCVAPSTVSSLVVGVIGSPFRRAWWEELMAASSSALNESLYSSLSVSSTKPRPGANAD